MASELVKHETARLKRYRVRGSIRLEIDESEILAFTKGEAREIAKDAALHSGERCEEIEVEEIEEI